MLILRVIHPIAHGRGLSTLAAALACIAVVAYTTHAQASSIVELTGAGRLELDVEGTLYLDTTGLNLTDLTLEATVVVIGSEVAAGIPDPAWTQLSFLDISALTSISLDQDAYFDQPVFSGSVIARAREIYIFGALTAVGDLLVNAAEITTVGCDDGSGAIIIGSTGFTTQPCGRGEVLLPPGGLIDTSPPIVIAGAVPEPTAALLFGAGLLVFSRPRRGRPVARRRG